MRWECLSHRKKERGTIHWNRKCRTYNRIKAGGTVQRKHNVVLHNLRKWRCRQWSCWNFIKSPVERKRIDRANFMSENSFFWWHRKEIRGIIKTVPWSFFAWNFIIKERHVEWHYIWQAARQEPIGRKTTF